MPRVWKHFLKNLAWPVGIAAYGVVVMILANYANAQFPGIGTVVVAVLVSVPVLTYLVRDMWRDAKEKVERENHEMMRTLKGKDYDF